MRSRPGVAALVVLLSSSVGACAVDDAGGRGELRVYAATSLRAVFTELETAFEAAHDDVDVALTFGGSSGLAAQIQQGAPAHVFAAADEDTMRSVVDEDATRPPVVFARNRLALVVEPGNPEGVSSLRDLARAGLVVVLCAPAVPCGRLALAALARAGVTVSARSLEENVGGVRSKVELGEADAGIVYATDVLDAGDRLDEVVDPLLDDPGLDAVYPMAVLDGAPSAAAAWVDHVRSSRSQATLRRHGFLVP